jgi:hypothetical protein
MRPGNPALETAVAHAFRGKSYVEIFDVVRGTLVASFQRTVAAVPLRADVWLAVGNDRADVVRIAVVDSGKVAR